MVSGGDVYLHGIRHGPGLAAYGADLPADVSHLWHGGTAGPHRAMGRLLGGRRPGPGHGPVCAPRDAVYGADLYGGIRIRRLAESPGHLPLGLLWPPVQYQRADPPGLRAPLVCHGPSL